LVSAQDEMTDGQRGGHRRCHDRRRFRSKEKIHTGEPGVAQGAREKRRARQRGEKGRGEEMQEGGDEGRVSIFSKINITQRFLQQ